MPSPDHPPDRGAGHRGLLRELAKLTPPPWEQLVRDVTRASTGRSHNPTRPLTRIGRFEAVGTSGVGGFGVVIEARDPKLDRQVALKLCRVRSDKATQVLMAEAKLLAKLSHPNIIPVYDVGQHGDDVFLVMEHADGHTAEQLPLQEPRPTWQEIVDIYRAAGRGLAAAHETGIVHGDFKPANILLDRFNRPRVADFGLGEVIVDKAPDGEQPELRQRPGTLAYMAPERLRGHRGDARSDQWSFSVSLWESLAGTLPFAGATSAELLDAIEHCELPPLGPSVPKRLRAIIQRGLSLDPSQRYPSMDALLHELDRLREPPVRRSRWVAFGAGLGVAFAGLFGLLTWDRASLAGEPTRAEPVPPTSEVSELIELPYPHNLLSPCAMGDEEVSIADEDLLKTCEQIRNGQLDSAQAGWDRLVIKRLSGDPLVLAADTLIVARTFVDHAEATWPAGPDDAVKAAERGKSWAQQSANLIDSREGLKDPRVIEIMIRADSLPSR